MISAGWKSWAWCMLGFLVAMALGWVFIPPVRDRYFWAAWIAGSQVLWLLLSRQARAKARADHRALELQREKEVLERQAKIDEAERDRRVSHTFEMTLEHYVGWNGRRQVVSEAWIVTGGEISIYFLNPAGQMRQSDAEAFNRLQFPEPDHPKHLLLRVKGTKHRDTRGTMTEDFEHFFLRSPFWSILDWGDDIVLRDKAGITVPTGTTGLAEEERITQVLQFATTYSSAADYTLRTIAAFGVPVLVNSRDAGMGLAELGQLRIALQLGPAIFEEGKALDFAGLLNRDPGRV